MVKGFESAGSRLYQDISRKLAANIARGIYPVGSRLPAERELAAHFKVSRPTIRESMIALEAQGIIEIRIGAGAFVVKVPGAPDLRGFDVTAFELSEARLLIESEAAALAATQISDKELAQLEDLVLKISQENLDSKGSEQADREFHIAIAHVTRNRALVEAVARLWELRRTSPECALLHAKARRAQIKPVVDEHTAILDALRVHDAAAARAAMRTHLTAVLDSLLFTTEEQAMEAARLASEQRRARYAYANGRL